MRGNAAKRTGRLGRIALALAVSAILGAGPAMSPAQETAPLANPVAAFTGLDKITGRITEFDVYIDETVQFGSLQITPRVCHSRGAGQSRGMTAFIEIDEVTLQSTVRRIFTGWMFADSPALNAVDNPVYDIWLTGCRQRSDVLPPDQRGARE